MECVGALDFTSLSDLTIPIPPYLPDLARFKGGHRHVRIGVATETVHLIFSENASQKSAKDSHGRSPSHTLLGCKGSLRSVCSKFFQNADSFLVSLFFSQVFAMSFEDSVLWISLVAVPTLAALAHQHLEIAAFPWRNVMNITSFNCCTVACM